MQIQDQNLSKKIMIFLLYMKISMRISWFKTFFFCVRTFRRFLDQSVWNSGLPFIADWMAGRIYSFM